MQSVVYYHDMKVQMEQIIQKIFSRAQKLHEENKLPNCPPALDTLFSSHNLQVEDYIRMLTDDLERKVSKLESSTESKYKRGLTKLSVQ